MDAPFIWYIVLRLNRWCKGAHKEIAQVVSSIGPMLSIPMALCAYREERAERTSLTLKLISYKQLEGVGMSMGTGRVKLLWVKTE